MIKICFISLNSYPLFVNRSTEYFGGAEVQMSLIAKELAKDSRFEVSVITGDYGQKKVISKKGLKIYKTKVNPVYFFKVLRQTKADVYVERTANIKVALVSLFCKLFKKKFVYMMAHDWDVDSKWLYYFGLKSADLIIAQTQDQKLKLKRGFNLNSVVMASVIKPTSNRRPKKREYILWVGRADTWKRPMSFIGLAEKLPNLKLVMICRQENDSNLFKKVKKQAEKLPNLKLVSAVPIEKIVDFFAKAKVLVNTSSAEGFPNTFLQAGTTKTPILSLKVSPDQYFDKYNCGFTANDEQKQMVKLCRKMLKKPRLLKTMGQNHYNYVKKNHGFKNIDIFKTNSVKLC